MKKIEKMIKDRPIAKKLSLIFQFILIAYLMLAAIGFVGMVQAKNYVGMAIIVVIVLVSIWFNNVRLQSILSKTLVEPIKNLVFEGNYALNNNASFTKTQLHYTPMWNFQTESIIRTSTKRSTMSSFLRMYTSWYSHSSLL